MPFAPRHLFALATLLCGLAVAAPAHAASPGLNISAYADAPQAVQQGAEQVRFFVPWRNFEPNSPRDFSARGPVAPSPLVDDLKTYVNRVRAAGKTPIMVLLDAPDWASSVADARPHKPPANATDFSAFAGELATWLHQKDGPAPVYEVWNEPDAADFWGGAPDVDLYTALLRNSYTAIKAGDPRALVLTGPTTGNNYAWIESLYARGAKGSFDGVAVHTDTACSIVGPDVFYRDPATGRLGRYTFLAYREVRASMLANGDDKPIWMSEIGWSTTSAVCASGDSAGKKAGGVSEADQAEFLSKGFACLANDPYVVSAQWFTLRDAPSHHYGLLRQDGSAKPAAARFAGAAGIGPGACGDFEPPAVNVIAPADGQQFVDRLDLRSAAADTGVGLQRITYTFDGGKRISAMDGLSNGGVFAMAPWYGSSELALGPHTIEVAALDKNGNTAKKVINVTKVAPGALKPTVAPRFKSVKRPSCRKAKTGARLTRCSISGFLSKGAGTDTIGGRVAVEWQFLNKKRQWRKLSGGLARASKPFVFRAVLSRKGSWRVRVVYAGQPPYKKSATPFVAFKVR